MKKNILLLIIIASLFAEGFVFAGNREGAFTVTPGLGYDFFSQKRNLQNTFALPEIALGYDFTRNWAVEGAYAAYNTSYRHDGVNDNASAKGNIYTLAALYHFNTYKMVEPYLSVGLGVIYLTPASTSANSEADANAAVGTQIFFGESVALRGEVRDMYTFAGGKNDVQLNLGVSFLIGGDNNTHESKISYKN